MQTDLSRGSRGTETDRAVGLGQESRSSGEREAEGMGRGADWVMGSGRRGLGSSRRTGSEEANGQGPVVAEELTVSVTLYSRPSRPNPDLFVSNWHPDLCHCVYPVRQNKQYSG